MAKDQAEERLKSENLRLTREVEEVSRRMQELQQTEGTEAIRLTRLVKELEARLQEEGRRDRHQKIEHFSEQTMGDLRKWLDETRSRAELAEK